MSINRADALDRQFRATFEDPDTLKQGPRPADLDQALCASSSLTGHQLLEIFEAQLNNRVLDYVARELRKIDEGFYTISSSGHEGNSLVAFHTSPRDMAFLHYRSGPFMMQRALQVPGQTPIYDTCLSFVASSEDPIAGGRHKVWGSVALNVPPQTSTIASHLPKAVGAAFAFERLKDQALKNSPLLQKDSIFITSFGDASANHASAQAAFNAASSAAYQHLPLPLLFVCEDNGLGISVKTPDNWIEASIKGRVGLSYHQANGLDVLEGFDAVAKAVQECRRKRRPVFLHLKTVRLMGHAGSDVETKYRSLKGIEEAEALDPFRTTAIRAVELGLLSPQEVLEAYDAKFAQVRAVAERACQRPRHESADTILEPLALKSQSESYKPVRVVHDSERHKVFGKRLPEDQRPRHMARLINDALKDLMIEDPRILIFGEDVARKGGVYTVTSELTENFGLKRVFNTILDETTILGVAIGAAQVGLLPIPEIQYLAYLMNAIDQLRGEACSLQFFSERQFANPMVVRIASFAYQRGFGGHFHNDNSIASLREIPGLIIAAPSSSGDAVGMLRQSVALARDQGAVVAFLEPIALYMTKDLIDGDGAWQESYSPSSVTPAFRAQCYGPEDAPLLIISYSNGSYLSRQAQADLAAEGHATRVLDMRWLAPLPEADIMAAAKKARAVLIVDEGRKAASVSDAVMALLCEHAGDAQSHRRWRRVVGDDTYIPLGRAWAHVLPSRAGIADAARALLESLSA